MNNRHAPAGYFGEGDLRRGGYFDSLLAPTSFHSAAPTTPAKIPEGPRRL